MDFSSLRGLVFFGILCFASFVLWPDPFLRLLTYKQQVWTVRRLTERHWSGVNVLFIVLIVALSGWLVLNEPCDAREQQLAEMRQDSVMDDSSGPLLLAIRPGRE